ncbi:hypothetical protein U1Q18_024101 [Sarracenia purpurea var. burkii]
MGLSIAHYKFWVRSWCVSSGLLSYDPLPSSGKSPSVGRGGCRLGVLLRMRGACVWELCLVMLPLEVLCLWFTLRNGIPAYAIARGSVVIRVGEVASLQSSLSFFWVLE